MMEVLLKYPWLWPHCLILALSPWINKDPLSGKTSTSPSWSTATSWSPRWRRRRTEVTALLLFRLSLKSSWKKSYFVWISGLAVKQVKARDRDADLVSWESVRDKSILISKKIMLLWALSVLKGMSNDFYWMSYIIESSSASTLLQFYIIIFFITFVAGS